MKNRSFKTVILALAAAAVICSLTGCALTEFTMPPGDAASSETSAETAPSEASASVEPSESISSAAVTGDAYDNTENSTEAASEAVTSEPAKSTTVFDTSKCYAYTTLNADEKEIYAEIYDILNGMKSDVRLSTLDTEATDRCFNCVMLDHPEIFYVSGYRLTTYTLAGKLTYIALSGKYTMDSAERDRRKALIDSCVNACLAGVPAGTDEYTRVKYVYDYIVGHTDYVADAPDSQNICSVFINGKSVCQGYTMATKYLLDKMGIFCTVVYGSANGVSHAWNLVKADGVYCYVDTTWGDASYRSATDGSTFNKTNYNYLGADSAILNETHTVSSTVELPACDSLASYYFVREGRYFDTVDMARLKDLFNAAYAAGETELTVKCSDRAVYDEMKKELFTDGKVFDLLQGTTKTQYVNDEAELTISFSLQL